MTSAARAVSGTRCRGLSHSCLLRRCRPDGTLGVEQPGSAGRSRGSGLRTEWRSSGAVRVRHAPPCVPAVPLTRSARPGQQSADLFDGPEAEAACQEFAPLTLCASWGLVLPWAVRPLGPSSPAPQGQEKHPSGPCFFLIRTPSVLVPFRPMRPSET